MKLGPDFSFVVVMVTCCVKVVLESLLQLKVIVHAVEQKSVADLRVGVSPWTSGQINDVLVNTSFKFWPSFNKFYLSLKLYFLLKLIIHFVMAISSNYENCSLFQIFLGGRTKTTCLINLLLLIPCPSTTVLVIFFHFKHFKNSGYWSEIMVMPQKKW